MQAPHEACLQHYIRTQPVTRACTTPAPAPPLPAQLLPTDMRPQCDTAALHNASAVYNPPAQHPPLHDPAAGVPHREVSILAPRHQAVHAAVVADVVGLRRVPARQHRGLRGRGPGVCTSCLLLPGLPGLGAPEALTTLAGTARAGGAMVPRQHSSARQRAARSVPSRTCRRLILPPPAPCCAAGPVVGGAESMTGMGMGMLLGACWGAAAGAGVGTGMLLGGAAGRCCCCCGGCCLGAADACDEAGAIMPGAVPFACKNGTYTQASCFYPAAVH